MMTRRSTIRRFFHAFAATGFVVATAAVYAGETPLVPDDQQSVQELPALQNPAPESPAQENSSSESPVSEAVVQPTTAQAHARPDAGNPSIILKGMLWLTKPGIVFLKTPIGLLTLSSKTTLKDFRASQYVSFWIHDAHLAIDIRNRSDGSLVHRFLSGPFTRHDEGDNKLWRWTPEGDKPFDFGAHERPLAALREGTSVTVEVDEKGTVIGIHDLQFDLQIGQIPAEGTAAHLLLSGTVSKLKSNFIFFRTPIGVINVNSKIGIKDAKVGQTLTLHVRHRNVVADLAAPNATAMTRRFVTGPLAFASPDHASIRLWTPNGEQVYPTDRGKAALAGVREGNPITVELTGDGTVVDFYRLN
ncbi:MAG: hypothetical protein FJ247_10830 [Nitrospira sp.]|nr:hypothetical protein [Nitrospira sp.]